EPSTPDPAQSMAISTDTSIHPVYDPDVIAQYAEDDEDLAAELLTIFTNQLNREAVSIAEALRDRDWNKLMSTAHRLKSSARTVGAMALADYCARLDNPGNVPADDIALALGGRIAAGIFETAEKIRANTGQ
ncbi:MAG: Hpt domain-containing protein, partial [Hydrogenophaga sp.]